VPAPAPVPEPPAPKVEEKPRVVAEQTIAATAKRIVERSESGEVRGGDMTAARDAVRAITARGGIITKIAIVGHTSVEGIYIDNLNTSEREARALAQHLGAASELPDDIFSVTGAGEDWDGLEAAVEASDIGYKQQILSIIRTVGIFAGRERDLMLLGGGAPYRQMRTQMFPRLRRVDYRIDYTVKE
jgi:hypothetical protein